MISNSGWAAPYGTYHRGCSTACSVCTMKVVFYFSPSLPQCLLKLTDIKTGFD